MQIGKRVRSSITEPRRTAQDKRFLERFQDNKEIGFAMLRLGTTSKALKPDSCAPPHLPHPALLGAALAPCTSCPQCTLLAVTLECSMNTRMTAKRWLQRPAAASGIRRLWRTRRAPRTRISPNRCGTCKS